jgi:purine-nucleoside phosphorylase
VLGFSIVTDMCLPDHLEPVRIEEIVAVANQAEAKLRAIVRGVLERWDG